MSVIRDIIDFIQLVFICIGAFIIELPLLILLYTAYIGYCICELVKTIYRKIRCYNI